MGIMMLSYFTRALWEIITVWKSFESHGWKATGLLQALVLEVSPVSSHDFICDHGTWFHVSDSRERIGKTWMEGQGDFRAELCSRSKPFPWWFWPFSMQISLPAPHGNTRRPMITFGRFRVLKKKMYYCEFQSALQKAQCKEFLSQ